MLDPLIENELILKLPFLLSSFKNLSTILTYLKEIHNIPLNTTRNNLSNSDYLKLVEHLKILLDYKDSILVVSPWSLKFDLQESKFKRGLDSEIDFDSPYEVYDINHNLLYSCVDHQGVYGLSFLDKWLVQKSRNMSTYYLRYKDIAGQSQVKLLVINLLSSQTLESNPYYKPKELPEVSSLVNIENRSRDTFIKLYVLYEAPSFNYNLNNIRINGEEIIISPDNQHIINSAQPYWVLIEDSATVTRGTNSSLVVDVIPNLVYYVGINTDVELLNKAFNTSIPSTTTFKNEQLIINTTF